MITIGPSPVQITGGGLGATVTWVDVSSGATDTGNIIKVAFTAQTTGTLYVGIFRWNGSNYVCQSATSFSVTATGYQEKDWTVAVQAGDYIGFYGIELKYNSSSGTNAYSITGNKCIPGQSVPPTYPYTNLMCLQGQGESEPTVTTQDATDVDVIDATGNGNITDLGGYTPDERGFEWGLVSGGPYPNSVTESGSFGTGAYSLTLEDLPYNTTIYYRAKAHNSVGWGYGAEKSFDTLEPNPETWPAVNIQQYQATGYGQSLVEFDEFGFDWGKVSGVYTDDVTEVATFTGIFSLEMTGLDADTLYYFRAKAKIDGVWWYGPEKSFTTLEDVPTVRTDVPDDVGTTHIVGKGTIESTGGDATCSEIGFVYGLTSHSNPGDTAPQDTDYDGYVTESGTYAATSFSKPIEGLTASKLYYVRAFAKNSYGYAYGLEILVLTNSNVNILYPNSDYSKGIRFDTSPGGGYPHPYMGTIPHYILVRNADASYTGGGRWGYVSGDIVYEYNYYNDNLYTDLYGLTNPTRRDVGVVKIKFKARTGGNGYGFGKARRELYTHSTQYSGSKYSIGGAFGWSCELFYTNPYTGAGWTISELDALIAGITLGEGGGFGTPCCDAVRVFVLWANAEVRTDPSTALGGTEFRLKGTVIEDEAEECDVYFEYGPDTGYGYTTTPQTKAKEDTFQDDVDIGVYPLHYRAVIETECGETFYGEDRSTEEEDEIGGDCFFKDYILAARTEIGWDEELQQATAGIAEFIVDNFNGDFNPENPAGAFYGTLALGVQITFSETYKGVEYLHFTGKIQKIVPNDDPADPTAYIMCLCGMDDLAGTKVTTALRTDTNVGELAEDVLDAAAWPAGDREIDSGIDTLDAGWFHKKEGLQAFRDLELTEKGRFFVKPNGKARFENRHYRITGDGLVSKHDFEDTAVRIEYEWSKRLLYNDVIVTGRRYFSGGVQLFAGYDLATLDSALIWSAHTGDSGAPYIPQNTTVTIWAETQSPIYEYTAMVKGTNWNANSSPDKSGTDLSDYITITETQYGQAVKLEIANSSNYGAYLVEPDTPPDTGAEGRTLLIYGVLFSSENVTIEEEDTDSQDDFGKKTLEVDAPFKSRPNDVLAYAQWLLSRYHEPIPNPVQVIHVARTNWPDDTLRIQCLARHISDRITIKSTKLGFDRDFYINKVIQEYVQNEGGTVHNTYWVVESAEGTAEELYWLLGVTGFGELGLATRLGF